MHPLGFLPGLRARLKRAQNRPPVATLWGGDALRDDRLSIIYMQAEITATKCLVVPRLIRMHPDWTDEQITKAAAHALLAAAPPTNLRVGAMGDVAAFRAYLAANPLPDMSSWRPGGEAAGAEILRTAAFWAADLKEAQGHDEAVIDAILTEWEEDRGPGMRGTHPP